MKYTMEELRLLNINRYCLDHALNQQDLDNVNSLVELLESRRNVDTPTPLDGDKAICVSPTDGEISTNGYLEIRESRISLCVWPSAPFVLSWGGTSASGGPWEGFSSQEHFLKSAEYVGKAPKLFKAWGHLGPCANGAVYFETEVHVWRVTYDRFYKNTY